MDIDERTTDQPTHPDIVPSRAKMIPNNTPIVEVRDLIREFAGLVPAKGCVEMEVISQDGKRRETHALPPSAASVFRRAQEMCRDRCWAPIRSPDCRRTES